MPALTEPEAYIAHVARPGVLNYMATIAVNKCTAGFIDHTVWQRELTDAELIEADWSAYLADAGWSTITRWQNEYEPEGGNDADDADGLLTARVKWTA
jgi:hypothetical protein